jgi:drug/metabolite transporter (DMT)-like permease
MKPTVVGGIVLAVLGVVALVYQGITYTSRETVLDIGPLHATADRERTLPLSPILGIVALAGGIVLVVTGSRARA